MLSSVLSYINGSKESSNETSFYIAFDDKHRVHFGFIINKKRYKIGFSLYNSYDFQKCIPFIEGSKDVDLLKLSKKFISNVETLNSIRKTIDTHLNKYEDDIEIYNTIIDNNFSVAIETVLDEVVSQQYLEEIIKKYVKFYHYSNWHIEKKKVNDKTIYYLILK